MAYPWSKKTIEEDSNPDDSSNELPISEDKETSKSGNETSNVDEKNNSEVWDNEDPRAIMLNILKLEGYKMDSGELFIAFKEASKNKDEENVMGEFSNAIENLSNLGKIKSDSDGNIMTAEDFDREKSQTTTEQKVDEENIKDNEAKEEEKDNDIEKNKSKNEGSSDEEPSTDSTSESDDLESIIKLKEETDSWLIDKLKDNNSSEDTKEIIKEVKEIKARVEKLENIIENLTKAFE